MVSDENWLVTCNGGVFHGENPHSIEFGFDKSNLYKVL